MSSQRHPIPESPRTAGYVKPLLPPAKPGLSLAEICLLGNPGDNSGTNCGIRNSQEGSNKRQDFLSRRELGLGFPRTGPKDSVAATKRSRSSGRFSSRVSDDCTAVKFHSDFPSPGFQ